jgi:hypothetical protein
VNNLLDNLRVGPYSHVFSTALYMRVFLWFGIALACLSWYRRALQELKREAIAASKLISD